MWFGMRPMLPVAGAIRDAMLASAGDLLTIAGAAQARNALLQVHLAETVAEGAVVDHALCVIDREAGGADVVGAEGIALHSLFRMSDLESP